MATSIAFTTAVREPNFKVKARVPDRREMLRMAAKATGEQRSLLRARGFGLVCQAVELLPEDEVSLTEYIAKCTQVLSRSGKLRPVLCS